MTGARLIKPLQALLAGRAGVHQSSSAIVSFEASIVVGEPRFRALPEKLIRLELEREHRTRTSKLNCLPVQQSRTPTLLVATLMPI